MVAIRFNGPPLRVPEVPLAEPALQAALQRSQSGSDCCGLALNAGPGLRHALLGRLPGRSQRRILLCRPLLHSLLPLAEYLGAQRELRLILLALGIGGGNGRVRHFHRSHGARTSFRKGLHKRAVQDKAIGEDQDKKNDHRRHRAERKTTELTQKFIYHDFAEDTGGIYWICLRTLGCNRAEILVSMERDTPLLYLLKSC